MSFPQLLTSRRLGEPGAQEKIEEALHRKIENALVNDCFHSTTIKLPKGFEHRILRSQHVVAILSANAETEQVALWSLITKGKLWEVKIAPDSHKLDLNFCKLSEQGMILVEVPSSYYTSRHKIILLNGKRSGKLPNLLWRSIDLVGTRILGHWEESRNPNSTDPLWLPENVNRFFGEYNEEGTSLNRYQLDSRPGQWWHVYTYNETYWVRLSNCDNNSLASIIEVVDRVMGKMKTYTLPLSANEERFSSPCLAQDRLFYGKSIIRLGDYKNEIHCEPVIVIFDLVKGTIIQEFPTGSKIGQAKKLVATQYYAAWLDYDYERPLNDRIKYLDIFNKTVKVATPVSYCLANEKIDLTISGTILSVIHATGSWIGGDALWHRKVIDMTNGELKCDVKYKRILKEDCSIKNGTLLITDGFSSEPNMYIESFSDEGISNEESTFRDKPTT